MVRTLGKLLVLLASLQAVPLQAGDTWQPPADL